MAELVTKTDLAATRENLQMGIGNVQTGLTHAVNLLDQKIEAQTLKLTVRLGVLMAAGIALLGAVLKLT